MSNICGIDFGTSNSTIGILKNNNPQLVKLEGSSKTIPSSIFYEDEENETVFGRQALGFYKDHYSGRLLRSFKSVLGTSLMDDKTIIRNRKVPFTEIIQDFLFHIKNQAELIEQTELNHAVIGRPINFVDNDEEKNKQAQKTLELIAKNAGFKSVEFQYEPIAASLKYEQSLKTEELVLIIDIGGGTTDISIVNLAPNFISMSDRTQHCLANCGVHIGGTDFDKNLSLESVMPLLGYKQQISKNLEMPKHIYHDMATWHRINNIYTPEFRRSILNFNRKLDEVYYDRLIEVLDYYLASSLAFAVEESKIELSNKDTVIKDLSFLEKDLTASFKHLDLENAVNNDLKRIEKTIEECLSQASIKKENIDSIFLTGGSSQMDLIRKYIQNIFPNTKIDNSDSLSSVGTGLVLDAARKFR